MACAPPGNRFEQDCTQCHDPEKRRRWGCDEPTAESYAFVDCVFCDGQNPECLHCNGTNRIELFRCPNQLVTRREIDAVGAAVLVERSVLPDPGGWRDQAHTFVQAYPLLAREIEHWRGVHQRIAMQKQQRPK